MKIIIPSHLKGCTLYAEDKKIVLDDSISKKDALIAKKYHEAIEVIDVESPPKKRKSKTQ